MEKSYWFDDGLEHSSNEMAEYFLGALETGVNVYGNPNALLVEKTTGMNVKVNPGIAYINGRYYKNDANLTIALTSTAGSVKHVRIVLRVDMPNKEIKAKVIEGDTLPTLTRTNDIYEISLAKIQIPASAANLSGATLIDERSDNTVCGFFRFAGHEAERVASGIVDYFAGAVAPVGWLECDGSLISRSVHPDLFNVIGTIYGAGDGSTTFALPDLRGEFIRGWDSGRDVDAGRVFGSAQEGTVMTVDDYGSRYVRGGDVSEAVYGFAGGSAGYKTRDTITMRPRSIALLPIIKI